ncbi:serine/threonine protein kinase [Streptomyces laurentii]|uniref:Serine/threonine protein kinase n=1 Tax=Streptomyces laurentii TaxID=39478 RepID=A0A160P0L6_STRLU|nr:serine/threonine protein kinase [Streptomyces laurentii]
MSAGRPLPERTVRALGTRLCAAPAQLHASDVVHRDLKPSNVLVSVDGTSLTALPAFWASTGLVQDPYGVGYGTRYGAGFSP